MLKARYATVLAIVVMVVSVVIVAMSDDSDGASGYSARIFVGDGTDGGTDELSGSGSDLESVLQDALGSRIVINANGTVRSLDGVVNTDSQNWYILQWRPPTGWVSVNANSAGDAYLESGTSYYVYYSDIIRGTDGKVRYSTPSSFEPVSTGYFYIKFVTDANANDYVKSVLTEEERLEGFWISGEGSDIAEAFMDACSDLRSRGNSGFQLDINDDPNNTLYGWLGSFMGLKDDDSPGNGLWNNWSQFAWNFDTNRWEYNNWCLGYYDPGVYPYFSVVRQITADDSASAGVTVTPSDIPSCVKNDSCTVRFVDGDGKTIKTQNVLYFGSATAPSNPTKQPSNGMTYTFTGWDRQFDQVVSDIIVNAQFKSSGSSTEGGVTDVSITSSKSIMYIGESFKFVATVEPSTAGNKAVVWSTSDSSVVTVDQNGNVKAISDGVATITVKTVDGGKTSTVTVTVKGGTDTPGGSDISVTGVRITSSVSDMKVGDSSTFKATVMPSNAENKAVVWSTSNSSVATIDQSGNVKAVSEGVVVITVTTEDGGRMDTIVVTVSSDASQVTIIDLGDWLTVSGKTKPMVIAGSSGVAKYVSSNTEVVTVDEDGNVTSKAPGMAKVTAEFQNVIGVMNVVVSGEDSEIIINGEENDGEWIVQLRIDASDLEGSVSIVKMDFGPLGVVELPLDGCPQLTPDSNESLSVRIIDSPRPVQKEVIGDSTLYEYLISGSDAKFDETVKVKMPYVLPNGSDADDVFVYQIDEYGKVLERIDCEYDGGFVTFDTTHFSMYFATTEEVSVEVAEGNDKGGSDVMLYVGMVVAAIAAVSIIAVVMKRRA